METAGAVKGRGITKVFDGIVALDHVDVNVAQGQIHGLVGPNGAGKTTLLGLLLGLAVADEGSLEILGTPVGRALAAPDGVSGFVDGPGLYPTLTAKQNLTTILELRPGNGHPAARAEEALERLGLRDVADEKVRGFSLGMRQRLGLAAALLTRPRLLVLDEPSNGLDPAGKQQVYAVLRRLAAEGVTVVLSSHRMDDLESLCSEITILATGRVMFSGPLSKLSSDERDLDYRLRTTDPPATRALIAETPGAAVVDGPEAPATLDGEVVIVRARVAALDALTARLARTNIAVRELAPVVSPLEAAFLALTENPGPPAQAGIAPTATDNSARPRETAARPQGGPPETTETPDTSQTPGATEPTEPIETTQPIEATQTTQPTETTQPTQTTQTTQPTETTEPNESIETTQPTQTTRAEATR